MTQRTEPVRRARVVTRGKAEMIGEGLARLQRVAGEAGVELVLDQDEAVKHQLDAPVDDEPADVTIVLGGDGTMLRALQRSLGKSCPVVGVNFGSVGFLTTIPSDDLEAGLKRVFSGEYEVVELPTLEAELWGERFVAVNDVVVASSVIGRMAHLAWEIGGEELGVVS